MKKGMLRVLALLLISFLISSCSGRNLPAEDGLPSGEKIIEKNIEATGGKRTLDRVRNNRTTLTIEMPGMGLEIKATSWKQRPDMDYTSADLGSMGEIKSGSDGRIAWEISPFSGPRLLEGNELAGKLLDNAFDGVNSWKKMYKSVINEGIETIDGKPCYKITFIPKEGMPRTIFFDTDTFLAVKAVSKIQTQEGVLEAERYYSDYRETGKILSARRIIVHMDGQPYQEITVEGIEHNIEMPEGTFDLPEEIKTLLARE